MTEGFPIVPCIHLDAPARQVPSDREMFKAHLWLCDQYSFDGWARWNDPRIVSIGVDSYTSYRTGKPVPLVRDLIIRIRKHGVATIKRNGKWPYEFTPNGIKINWEIVDDD